MGALDRLLMPNGVKLGTVMQVMTDFKVSPEYLDPAVQNIVGKLRQEANLHQFTKGDKLPAHLRWRAGEPLQLSGKLPIELYGGALGEFIRPMAIPLSDKAPNGEVQSLEHALQLISRTDPGGNAPNEMRNLVRLMEGGVGPEHLHLFTSSDALFEEWLQSVQGPVRDHIAVTRLSFASRMGVHLPYRLTERNGTLGISSPADTTRGPIRPHFADLLSCNHVIVSEGLGREIQASGMEEGHSLQQKMNPSSGLRADCALDAYEYVQAGGPPPFATMNDEETDFYIRVLKGRVEGVDPEKLDPIPFPSPFGTGAEISESAVMRANASFNEYFQYVPHRESETLQFPLNVSCGGRGGYHAAMVRGRHYLVFSTVPEEHGVAKLLDLAGNPHGIHKETERSMGAGDAVGALLSLANAWDATELLGEYAVQAGRQTPDERYLHIAGIVFVSLLSRIFGEYLFHTERTDFTEIPAERIRHIVDFAAQQALLVADQVWNAGPRPKVAKVEDLGIKVALWEQLRMSPA